MFQLAGEDTFGVHVADFFDLKGTFEAGRISVKLINLISPRSSERISRRRLKRASVNENHTY